MSLLCAEQCNRRCHGPKPGDCCNDHCAAGCTGPQAHECLACKDFNDDGTCKDTCPPLKIYNSKLEQVIDNPNAKYNYGAMCVKACPHNYVVTEGSCVRSCRAGLHEVNENGVQRCKPCEGPCPKACDGIGIGSLTNAMAVNSSNIDSFKECTKINGNIIFIELVLIGCFRDPHYQIPPMDPEKLENFRTVKEITGYLMISSWPQNRTSLSVFENLEMIRGRSKVQNQYSLVMVNLKHLRWLGLRSLKEVSAGNVMLKLNSDLCYTQTVNWSLLFKSKDQTNKSVGSQCSQQNQTCDYECSKDGCWGPGPTMCLSCRHFDRRGRCVAQCNLLQGEPREVEINGHCVECHSECFTMSGDSTCRGPGPGNCSKCAHYKDGHLCVARCPHGVLGDKNTLIWKYPDKSAQCQLCHPNCTQGCSGPGLSGCPGEMKHSTLAVAVVGGLLVAVILLLLILVLLRRRRIKKKRDLRRILQEKEVGRYCCNKSRLRVIQNRRNR
uniref:receptor protein-tyrosine kinase n=1 Tax=Kryptolebias marmoratus TaxID=37003 RepID=A0A3Q2ZN17_KRYMA